MNRPAAQNEGVRVVMKGEQRSRDVDTLNDTEMGSWINHQLPSRDQYMISSSKGSHFEFSADVHA